MMIAAWQCEKCEKYIGMGLACDICKRYMPVQLPEEALRAAALAAHVSCALLLEGQAAEYDRVARLGYERELNLAAAGALHAAAAAIRRISP